MDKSLRQNSQFRASPKGFISLIIYRSLIKIINGCLILTGLAKFGSKIISATFYETWDEADTEWSKFKNNLHVVYFVLEH